jgi:uncharacterized membrane protein YdjX (TVP38/TMEM64 family)
MHEKSNPTILVYTVFMKLRTQQLFRISPLFIDCCFIFLSIVLAFFLAQSGILETAIVHLGPLKLVGAFIAGMFFTSVFTTVPSLTLLSEIAHFQDPFLVAAIGGAGAVLGDLVIFTFVRDRFSHDLQELFSIKHSQERLRKLSQIKFFRWFILFFGGLIIASPLPDELGVSLLGLAKVPTSWFIPISYIFNTMGILVVTLAAKGIIG